MKTKIRSVITACTGIGNTKYPFGIGINGTLPWHLPKEFTHPIKSDEKPEGISGIPLIMGRKNFESFPKQEPLPGRTSIVLTENPLWQPPHYEDYDNIRIAHSGWEALQIAESCPGDEIFIIGGEDVYRWYAENVIIHRLYITFVHANLLECDRFFPIDLFDLEKNYQMKENTTYPADEKNQYGFTIRLYELKKF